MHRRRDRLKVRGTSSTIASLPLLPLLPASGLAQRLVLLLLALLLGGCVTSGRLPEAIGAWRSGAKDRAMLLARAEYERFRDGNDLTEAQIGHDLEALIDVLRSPLVLPGDEAQVGTPEAEGLLRGGLAAGLRRDLQSSGVMRVLRAVRSVMRLGISRHGVDLLAIVWHRDPFAVDHASVNPLEAARRSLVVKRAALDALRTLD